MPAASAKWRNPFYLLFVVWLVGGGLYILYAWTTYSELYRWAAEWEMAQFGSYEVEGTLVGLFFALIGLPAGVLALFGKLLGRSDASSAFTAAMGKPAVGTRQASPRLFVLLGLVALLVAAGAGWLGYHKSQQPVTFEAVNLAD